MHFFLLSHIYDLLHKEESAADVKHLHKNLFLVLGQVCFDYKFSSFLSD